MTDHLMCLLILYEQKNPVFKILLDDKGECFITNELILGRGFFNLIEYIFSPMYTLQKIVARSTMGIQIQYSKNKKPSSNTVTDLNSMYVCGFRISRQMLCLSV